MESTLIQSAFEQAGTVPRASSSHRLEPLRHIEAGVLDIAYYEAGPPDGPVVMLLHGFRHLPVMEGREVSGVVSLRDLAAARITRHASRG